MRKRELHRKLAKAMHETRYGKPHPGFAAVEKSIEKKEGVSKKSAGAILAASSRNASAKAKRANPALRKVKG